MKSDVKKIHKKREGTSRFVTRVTSVVLSLMLTLSLFSVGFDVGAVETTNSQTEKTTVVEATEKSAKQPTVADTTKATGKRVDKVENVVETTEPSTSNKKAKVKTEAKVDKVEVGALSGGCGDNATWSYDTSTATLTISGTGSMISSSTGTYPWNSTYSDIIQYNVTNLVIEYGITTISKSAFDGCTGLTNATIPNSVTYIEKEAFDGCSGLTNITIPNSVTTIGASAFLGCTGLTNITIPNSVTSIGRSAFSGCSGLTSVTISNNITTIDEQAFIGCTGLTSVTIPDSVTSIGVHAFSGCTNLTSVTIPSSVTSIGGSAFYGCDSITNLTISGSASYVYNIPLSKVKNLTITGNTIRDSIISYFKGKNLTSITIDNSNNYDSRNNCNAIIETATNKLILGCKNTIIPNSVSSIGNSAFRGCTGLTSITIPNSVTSIGESAFSGCTNLAAITLPDNVDINDSVFGNTDLYNDESNWDDDGILYIDNYLIEANDEFAENTNGVYHIKTGTRGIASFAFGAQYFADYDNSVGLVIPDSVTIINTDAFRDSEFAFIKLPDSLCDHQQRLITECSNIIMSPNNPIYNKICNANYEEAEESEDQDLYYDEHYMICNKIIVEVSNETDIKKLEQWNTDINSSIDVYLSDNIELNNKLNINNILASSNCGQINLHLCELDYSTAELDAGDAHVISGNSNNALIDVKGKLNIYDETNGQGGILNSNGKSFKLEEGASLLIEGGKYSEDVSQYISEDIAYDSLPSDQQKRKTVRANLKTNDSVTSSIVDVSNFKSIYTTLSYSNVESCDILIKWYDSNNNLVTQENAVDKDTITCKGTKMQVVFSNPVRKPDCSYYYAYLDYTGNLKDTKVCAKTGNTYTVCKTATKDMTLENDGHTFVLDNVDTFERQQLLGVQIRPETDKVSQAMRFVSVVRSDLLRGAKDYGFVLAKGKNVENMRTNKNNILADSDNCLKVSAKGSSNTLADEAYSSNNLNEGNYKYLTAAITDIDDDNAAIGAKLYIERQDGTYVYADYTCVSTMGEVKAMAA